MYLILHTAVEVSLCKWILSLISWAKILQKTYKVWSIPVTKSPCVLQLFLVNSLFYINQSINQIFYSANIPSTARHSDVTAKSMKQFHNINQSSGVPVSMGERPCRKDVSRHVTWRLQLKWLNGQTAAGCSREKSAWLKCSAPALALTLGTDRVFPLFNLREQDGSDGASMDWQETGCFSQRISWVSNWSWNQL